MIRSPSVGCTSPPVSGLSSGDSLSKYDRTACANIAAGAKCTVGCGTNYVLSPGTTRTTFTCTVDSKTKKPAWDAKPKWPVCVRMWLKITFSLAQRNPGNLTRLFALGRSMLQALSLCISSRSLSSCHHA
jgi:hypothetical protein